MTGFLLIMGGLLALTVGGLWLARWSLDRRDKGGPP